MRMTPLSCWMNGQSFSSLTGLTGLFYLIDWKAWGARVSNRTQRIADSPRNLILMESPQLQGENEIEVTFEVWRRLILVHQKRVFWTCGSNNVLLILGLNQNNGIGLSETFPINTSQHSCTPGDPLLHGLHGHLWATCPIFLFHHLWF